MADTTIFFDKIAHNIATLHAMILMPLFYVAADAAIFAAMLIVDYHCRC